MRKIVLVTITCILSTVLYGQEDTLKSRDGDWGFTFNLNGLINNINLSNLKDVNNNNAILAKHHLTNDKVIRIGVGVFQLNKQWLNADSVAQTLVEVDSTEKRFDISFSLGVEKHLGNTKRLDPYLGGEIVVGAVGKTKVNADTKITDATGTGTIQRIINQDGGVTLGVNLIAGFNYFFSERISIGAEYNLGYMTSKMGGDFNESVVNQPVSGSSTSNFITSERTEKSSGLQINSTAGLMLSFFF